MNSNAINIALGSTVGGITKPANIPYLNLFCDPTKFTCNSPATLAYITANRLLAVSYQIEEKGARFDGPLFSLPAGQVKAAVGGVYESDNVLGVAASNAATPTALRPLRRSTIRSPTIFGQGLPRSIFPCSAIVSISPWSASSIWKPHGVTISTTACFSTGGTSNPKVAFTWLIDELVGATVRGSWGTSFRFANAGESSTILRGDANADFNYNGEFLYPFNASAARRPRASASATLFAAGFGCGKLPGGLNWSGGPAPRVAQLRRSHDRPCHQPRRWPQSPAGEIETTTASASSLAPQTFLRGLDLQATWYSVKVNGTLLGFTNTTAQTLDDPSQLFHVILPSQLGCPVAANANPTTCAPFEKMALAALGDRNSTEPITTVTNIYWINDGSTVGTGFLKVSGIDWNASYDWDWGDLGAWNTGITGTYYLHRYNQTVPGTPVNDQLHQNIQPAGGIVQNGVETTPRMIYRARLGWSSGPYSVTGFVNYISHFFAPWAIPPNVNFQCTAAGGSTGGGTFPCAISNYSSIEPSWYTFDLSFGYDTGDQPANTYLKNVTVQLTVQNLLDKHSSFEYGPSISTRNVAAYDLLKPNTGRVIGVTLLKSW